MNDWTAQTDSLPEMAERVIVQTNEGSLLFARRVKDPSADWRWIDDQSCPIRGVTVWKRVVASGENQ